MEHFDRSMQNGNANEIPVKHSYLKPGIYRVTLTGDCDNLYGYNGIVSQGAKRSWHLVNCLWGVVVPKDSFSPLKYGYGSFFGCQTLAHVGYGVFHNIQPCKEVPHLYDGAVLKRIEPWMLYGGDNLENVEYTFENCQMLEVDKDIFKYCNKVTNANHCFHRCNKLKSIPEGLFDPMPELKSVNMCFQSCTDLVNVPSNLFELNVKITDFAYCFCGGRWNGDSAYNAQMAITDPLPEVWTRTNVTSHRGYAHGCTTAANYASIPRSWID